MITIEQGHERSLSSSGTLDTSELEIIASTFKVAKIPKQFLDPKSGTFSDSNELSWLEVSETKSGHIAILGSKLGKNVNDAGQLLQNNVITITDDHQITVIYIRELVIFYCDT